MARIYISCYLGGEDPDPVEEIIYVTDPDQTHGMNDEIIFEIPDMLQDDHVKACAYLQEVENKIKALAPQEA